MPRPGQLFAAHYLTSKKSPAMPPKAAKKGAALPLEGCSIALSGKFPRTQTALEQDLITSLGATLAKTVNSSTTHLITTETDFEKLSGKVKLAKSHDVQIVKLSWLEDCLDKATRLKEDDYRFDAPAAASTANGKVDSSRKRAAEESENESQSQKPTKKAKAINGTSTQPQSALSVKAESKTSSSKADITNGLTNIAKSGDLLVPVDEHCPLTHYRVYIDSNNVIYDAALNQTNSGNNNNKFYRVQLLYNGSDYKTWTRWGRVGDRGQSKILGGGGLADAMKNFDSKFKDKSGLNWSNRGDKPKAGKYTFLERTYGDDSEDEEDPSPVKLEEIEERLPSPESTLSQPVQDLMALIFNQQYFAATMTDLNYDVNKLPLGKLSKFTITRGYQALKHLSALIDDPALAQSEYGTSYQAATEQLSNAFYSLIPHAFGRNRPPVIQDQTMLNKEIDLLDSLSDMKDAAIIMKKEPKDIEKMNALDRQFKGLNLDEMTPLKKSSMEFIELKNYLVETKGQTHHANYQVDQIFRIERRGEKERFEKSPFSGSPLNRRLLWHGSRTTNFGGILSQGLRIAPPEAPVSGYMFGKGIYLADMNKNLLPPSESAHLNNF